MRHLLACLLFCLSAFQAQAANKFAMVVGNNSYSNLDAAQQLQSAHNDADAVAALLRANGFTVFHGTDLTRNAFIQMLFDFTGALGDGDIALFFYAGHGVSIDGANYLLPSDIPATASSRRMEARRLASLSVHEQSILSAMKDSGALVSLAILDACRDNPLKNAAGRSIGATRGLQRIEALPQGTFSIYSAGYGQVALDRLPGEDAGVNSVFTRVLLDKLAQPGMTVRQLALSTRAEVRQLAASAGHVQSPAYYDELGTAEPVLLTLPSETTPRAGDRTTSGNIDDQIELMMIEEIRDSDDPAELQAYLDAYPAGRFAALARARLLRLQGAVDGDALAKQIKDLQSARQADQMMIAALQQALEDRKSSASALFRRAAQLKADLTRQRGLTRDAEFKARQLQKQLDEAQSAAPDTQNGALAQELATAQQDLAAARQEISDSHKHIDALRLQLGKVQALLDDAKDRDQMREVQLENLGSQLNAALARLAAEDRRRSELEAQLAALRKQQRPSSAPAHQAGARTDAQELNTRLRDAILAVRTSSYRRITLNPGDKTGISLRVSDLFQPDGRTLSDDGKRQLLQMRYQLGRLDISDATGPVQLDIIGHTDAPGSAEANQRLSEARAQTVSAMFDRASVTSRMSVSARGAGESELLVPGTSPAANQTNRRIEFRLRYAD